MAEILEKQTCKACGAEIRPKALFCYNCGLQVGSDEEVEAENARQKKISDAWFKEEIAPTPKPAKSPAKVQKTKVATEEKKETVENGKKSEAATAGSIKLKSAASMRDKSKMAEKKQVEVVWEEPSTAPNVWFLIVSLILIGFAVFVLFAMLYIR
ncbi:MAG: zinc ribbon domain-containing protein [Pyrinomonadaceae bacterium]|nr:zinc ribbon domain-containing protein [Pyrinomonadaceae bacterium]